MKVQLQEPVRYQLQMNEGIVDMNELIGHPIHMAYSGQINCIVCGRKIKKAFGQGFCYPCFINAPENSECIIRPELCRAHEGIGRDPEWEKNNHLQPHTVYLALSSALKVGVTRDTQIPTRWIDQGAWKALTLAETPNRYLAGCIEVALKNHLSDKTHWQKMLKNILAEDTDLMEEKEKIKQLIPEEFQQYFHSSSEITEIHYPVQAYPTKVKSINLDKTPEFEGNLMGIKGQYLIFEDERVINLRKFSGYFVELSV
ncbi:DUF2797 domain-containing protein [Xanthovirga aplysinae]|uniref:DUF2797 domain-containing protein n=1 Tax=Xanthovirga aplysinae TaxID=2529853 RepID=UPI001CA3F205|nr:DUF2797 domain-containing protein [Xanthovirga aplysinae]